MDSKKDSQSKLIIVIIFFSFLIFFETLNVTTCKKTTFHQFRNDSKFKEGLTNDLVN